MANETAARWSVILKIVVILLTAAALSPPITDPILFSILFLAALVTVFNEIRVGQRRWIAAIAIAAFSILLQTLLPATRILEQHNLFLRLNDGEAVQRALPEAVYADMAQSFERQYPLAQRCDKRKFGCWVGFGVPHSGFAWSADHAFGEPTRIVSGIDFHDIGSFRLGVINEIKYNWYDGAYPPDSNATASDIKRDSAPYFVIYKFPPPLVGSTLCIKGISFWREGTAELQRFAAGESSCRQITNPDTDVFAYSFDPKAPLAIQLHKTAARLAWDWAVLALRLLAAVCVPWLLVSVAMPSALPIALGAAGLLAVYWTYPTLLTEFRVHDSGNDGLTHEGYARLMLQAALNGKWVDAFRGVEPIFYYMPGLRYFRVLEKLAFGDTNFGYVAAVAALPIAVFAVLRELVPPRIGFVLAAAFAATAVLLPHFVLGFFPFIQFAEQGYPDTLGYLLFLIAVTYGFRTEREPEALPAIVTGFTFALAVFTRPNLVIGGAVFLSLLGLLLINRKQWQTLFCAAIGLAPAFLITLHNYVFGGKLVLLTDAAFIKENLFLSPGQYVSALAWRLFGSGSPEDFALAKQHLTEWLMILPRHNANWLNEVLLIAPVLLCFVPGQTWRVRTLVATALALHSVLWFWHAYDRYALLAWMLTLFALVGGLASLSQNTTLVRLVGRPALKV
jgi:hypothetical protein